MLCKTIPLLVLLGLWPLRLFGAEPPDAHSAARKPAELLKVALDAEPLSDAGAEMKRLRDAAAEVVQHLGLDHLGAESLRVVVERNEAADPAEEEVFAGGRRIRSHCKGVEAPSALHGPAPPPRDAAP